MKNIHKAPIIIVMLAALAVFFVLLIQGSSCGRKNIGLFSWDFAAVMSDTDTFKEIALKLGITELYQEFPAGSDGELRSFLDEMHDADISVYYLTGKATITAST